jgi:hypothetical protein
MLVVGGGINLPLIGQAYECADPKCGHHCVQFGQGDHYLPAAPKPTQLLARLQQVFKGDQNPLKARRFSP